MCFSSPVVSTIGRNGGIRGIRFWVALCALAILALCGLKTVNMILKQVYNEKLINTSLSIHSLKKLFLDTCQKMSLSFNNKLYEKIDGVSMG